MSPWWRTRRSAPQVRVPARPFCGAGAPSCVGAGLSDKRDHGSELPALLDRADVAAIARKHAATPAQVLLAWALARGVSVIPKSVRAERVAENFGALRVRLDAAEVATLDALDAGERGRFFQQTWMGVPGFA